MSKRAYNRRDHLYHEAKEAGWRSRAAFKLIELQKKYNLIPKNGNILDLGAAPGGWIQVCLQNCSPQAQIIAIDLERIAPFDDDRLLLIYGDILSDVLEDNLNNTFNNNAVAIDLILSDMSPKLSGIAEADAHRATHLAEVALSTAHKFLKPGGNFVVKLFKNQDSERFFKTYKRLFKDARRVELDSTRRTSKEFYMVGKGFIR